MITHTSLSARRRRRPLVALAAACAAVVLAAVSGAVPALGFDGPTLRTTSVTTNYAAQHIRIRIVCPGGTKSTPRPGDFSFCTGSMRVTYQGRLVAQGPFSVRTGDSHIEGIVTTRLGRRLFRPRRHVRVRFSMTAHDGEGTYVSRAGSLDVVNPYKH